MRDVGEGEQRPGRLSGITLTQEPERQGERIIPKSPLSPDKESQREERNSVIDAVKQITGAQKETPT